MCERDESKSIGAKIIPMLVIKFGLGKWCHSYAVPHVGTKHVCGARKLADAVVLSGHPKLIVKTRNEPAILELEKAASQLAREEVA